MLKWISENNRLPQYVPEMGDEHKENIYSKTLDKFKTQNSIEINNDSKFIRLLKWINEHDGIRPDMLSEDIEEVKHALFLYGVKHSIIFANIDKYKVMAEHAGYPNLLP